MIGFIEGKIAEKAASIDYISQVNEKLRHE